MVENALSPITAKFSFSDCGMNEHVISIFVRSSCVTLNCAYTALALRWDASKRVVCEAESKLTTAALITLLMAKRYKRGLRGRVRLHPCAALVRCPCAIKITAMQQWPQATTVK